MTDLERLRQVLVNLLTNAVKYTVAGDEIEVVAAPGNGSVAVRVRDHGPGIPPESQRLVFEKFGRVSQDGGTLDVESESGAGATFVLQLPATRA